MPSETFEYREADRAFEAYVSTPDERDARRPAVLVCHALAGQSDLERGFADDLARLGHVGIALDNYGKATRGASPDECRTHMRALLDDRALLRRRLEAGLAAARAHRLVDPARVAVIGFCFGGLCALDLARSGADLRGVISFHGLLDPPSWPVERIRASVLALHGHDDPLAPPEAARAFEKEMTAAGADWQLHSFGGVKHSFTNPRANAPERGLVYDERAARRARRLMEVFLGEVL